MIVKAASLGELLTAEMAGELVLFFFRCVNSFVCLQRASCLETLLTVSALVTTLRLVHISDVGPNMCVWKILEASITLADEAGFVEVLPNVVPHLLEVVGKEQARMLSAFVFNILRPVTGLPVFDKILMAPAVLTTTTAGGERWCLKHSHPLLLQREFIFPR